MTKQDDEDLARHLWALREASAELDAIAYLFRLKRTDETPPLDMEQINLGLSKIIERLGKRVFRAARRIEEADLKSRRFSIDQCS